VSAVKKLCRLAKSLLIRNLEEDKKEDGRKGLFLEFGRLEVSQHGQ
jgi:hypothetical protein